MSAKVGKGGMERRAGRERDFPGLTTTRRTANKDNKREREREEQDNGQFAITSDEMGHNKQRH